MKNKEKEGKPMEKIIAAMLFLMLAMPFTAQAHTALTSSNPSQGEQLAETPKELELVFGTVIEEGSTMTLKGPEMDVAIEDILIAENVMKGSITDGLENGQYIISWKIIGEDGHPIDGELVFSVNAPASEEAAAPSPEEPAAEEPAAAEPVEAASENLAAATEATEDSGVLTMLLLIAITVLVGFGSVLLIKMKR